MLRTIQCPLPYDDTLVQTIKVYNQVVQYVLDVGWEIRDYNKMRLHHKTYYKIRQKYPMLQSSLVQCARDQASVLLKIAKNRDFRCKKPVKSVFGSINYNHRTFTIFWEKKELSICTIEKRRRYPLKIPPYFHQYLSGKIKSLTLSCNRKKRLRANFVIELPDHPAGESRDFLGVDMGERRFAVCSDITFYPTKHIKQTKYKYQRLRQELQAKGTRSSKRKLKHLSGRERRFMANENRKIAKWILRKKVDTIVIEQLTGIKANMKKSRRFNKKTRKRLNNWAYYQLQLFLIERAEKTGKLILIVPPEYTSQRCSRCGDVAKKNRISQSIFRCKNCGFELNADLNASRNLFAFGIAVRERASVNSPNVAISPPKLSIKLVDKPSHSVFGGADQLQALEFIQG
ncbi:MAG: RNA-guided endonuclease InsQ/TnpB family protein [Candidatus Hodarchaeota archaeon]